MVEKKGKEKMRKKNTLLSNFVSRLSPSPSQNVSQNMLLSTGEEKGVGVVEPKNNLRSMTAR